MSDAIDRASQRWAGLELDRARFDEFRAERPGELASDEELVLVFACLAQNARALEIFEKEFIAPLRGVVRRFDVDVDEVLQLIRTQLLVGPPPRLEQFRGVAPLGAWLRAIATRAALNARRPAGGLERTGDEVLELVSVGGPAPEVRMLRLEHASTFSEAFREAFQQLSPRQRNALRLQSLEALTLDQIGTIYSVNKATVSRWLSEARESLEKRVRNSLVGRLGLSGVELESFILAMRSQLELASLLRTETAA
ncbi:MAG: sigma-70 family RNA polymerase sigma factor [Archangium sp.]